MQLKPEWQIRCKLAALYRIFDLLGWTDTIFTHISARIPDTDFILMNPYGKLYKEITASSLIKVSLTDSSFIRDNINTVGYNIHSAIHNARPEINYVLHTHTVPIVTVSSLQEGLLPISQYGLYIANNLSYHNYGGIFFWEDEKDTLVKSIGNKNTFCLMRNHGSLVLSKDIDQALFNQYILQKACEVQIMVQSTNQPYILLDDAIIDRTVEYTNTKQNKQEKAPHLLWDAMIRQIGNEYEC